MITSIAAPSPSVATISSGDAQVSGGLARPAPVQSPDSGDGEGKGAKAAQAGGAKQKNNAPPVNFSSDDFLPGGSAYTATASIPAGTNAAARGQFVDILV